MVAAALFLGGCTGQSDDSLARSEIEAAIARGVEATRTQDIDAYMALIPEDAVLHDGGGAIITRDELRANALRDWSIIPKTLSISVAIDSIAVNGDTAIVHTSQRWERLMLQRDGETTDTVLTTQRHKETWRKAPGGWFAYEVEELGGEVFINGERYQPGG
jgi:ketosteroid isomerase-like protein